MDDDAKIERLKEHLHRLSVAKVELEDENAALRADLADRKTNVSALLASAARALTAARELLGAND
jgi:hypothetical protein